MIKTKSKNVVLFKGKSSKGTDIIIRYHRMSDLKELCKYTNALSKERIFVAYQGEKVSLKQEKEWLKESLNRMKKGCEVGLSVFIGQKVIGMCGIRMYQKVKRHVGNLGITISKGYRNEGIGWLFMNTTMKEAKNKLKGLKVIVLEVYEKNLSAINFYKKLGFKEYGFLPGGLLYKGKQTGEVSMYKKV